MKVFSKLAGNSSKAVSDDINPETRKLFSLFVNDPSEDGMVQLNGALFRDEKVLSHQPPLSFFTMQFLRLLIERFSDLLRFLVALLLLSPLSSLLSPLSSLLLPRAPTCSNARLQSP